MGIITAPISNDGLEDEKGENTAVLRTRGFCLCHGHVQHCRYTRCPSQHIWHLLSFQGVLEAHRQFLSFLTARQPLELGGLDLGPGCVYLSRLSKLFVPQVPPLRKITVVPSPRAAVSWGGCSSIRRVWLIYLRTLLVVAL